MKKALILATVPSIIQQFNINNIEILQKLGYKVDVAANFQDGGNIDNDRLIKFKKELREAKVNYIDIPFSRSPFSIQNIKAYKCTKKTINDNKYNIVHLHSPVGGVCGRIATKYLRENGTKVIYTAHGFHFYKGAPLQNWLIFYPIEKYLSKYTDCLITINGEDYDLAKKKFKVNRIELVYGVGVDESRFKIDMTDEEKKQLKDSIGINENDFVMIIVGELNKNKNQLLAINAMKEIVKDNKNIKLILIGIGELEEYYRKIIKENNLDEYIKLLGYRTDVPKLLKISDVLLSLSFREGLPVNVMEAMASGLPVIATNCRGNRDLVQDDINGYIISQGDKEEFNNYIKKIYNKEVDINKLKENAQQTSEQYTLKNILGFYKEIYEFIEEKI